MLLLKTSINLRNDLPWNDVYSKCIYPWLNGSVNKRTGKKNYERLLRKLTPKIDIKDNESKKFEFAGDFLQYDSLVFNGEQYICFVHGTLNMGCLWRTRVALKRTSDHLLCYVSLDCKLERAAKIPKFSKPRIIDYLIKFQDGDGDIEFNQDAHILQPTDVNDAKNIFLGKKNNKLPVVYLSCAERTHAIKPKELAKTLYGVAHVYAEKDNTLSDRIRIDVNTPFPKKGAIGICNPGQPVSIINRNGASPEDFVQKIYLSILKNSLTAKFDFSWDDFVDVQNKQKKALAEQEKRNALVHQQKVNEENKKVFSDSEFTAIMGRLKDILAKPSKTAESKNEQKKLIEDYKELKAKYDELVNTSAKQAEDIARLNQELADAKADTDSWKSKHDNLKVEYDTFVKMADNVETEKNELSDKVITQDATITSLQANLERIKKQRGNYIPLLMPKDEMFEDETLCQVINVLKEARNFLPRAKIGHTQRSFDVFDNILKANNDAMAKFKEVEKAKAELEDLAESAQLNKDRANKVMKPFGIIAEQMGCNHYEILFQKGGSKRYKGVEASTPSNKRGSINGGKDTVKALLW